MTVKRLDPDGARSAAIAMLARRDHASAELRSRLERKGFDRQIVEATIQDLVDEHALNDERYATHYVSYRAARGQGPIRIAAELRALELPDGLVQQALASGPDWQALAAEVRQRKFGSSLPAAWPQKVRQARFLQYRGFSSDHIHSALGAELDLD